MGKGDKLRPVNKKKYDENFDKINWNKKSKEEKTDETNDSNLQT